MSFYEKCPPHHEVSKPNYHFNSTNAENECNSKEVKESAAEECQIKNNLHVGEIEEEKNDQIQLEMNYEGGQSTEEIEESATEECQTKNNLNAGEIEEEKNDQIRLEMNYEGGQSTEEIEESATEECQTKNNLNAGEIEEEKNDQIQIEMNYEGGGQSTEEIEVEQYVDIESVDNFFESEEKHFSVKQSNMLFLLFLLSSLLCILADLWHQWKRGISSQYKYKYINVPLITVLMLS